MFGSGEQTGDVGKQEIIFSDYKPIFLHLKQAWFYM